MTYLRTGLGNFGKNKGSVKLMPPPEDIGPVISPEEEEAIFTALLPLPEPEPSFLRRNAAVLLIGGGALLFGTIGMVLMLR